MDESCLGTPQRVGFGGLIRNYVGRYLSGFSSFISNSEDILLAELVICILRNWNFLNRIYVAIEKAEQMDWKQIWLESDSMLAVKAFNQNSPVSWFLKNRWLNCKVFSSSIVHLFVFALISIEREMLLLAPWFVMAKVCNL
ncbi:hypothetical protein MTR_1g059640 [Medicago truncatula]|uniref:RNase H type-1 domain-containing protein n=1 Tax=Medicago truncatula TaxID=3880 RepID=A0A072VKQ0_MEDTR|nr:hypothetical protein MTR_1g059640 [Medicago truncatula]